MMLTNFRPRIAALGALVAVAAIALFALPEPAAAEGCVNNDDFECASVVGALPFSETINNAGFTIETGEPNPTCIDGQTDGLTAWWTWTAPSTDSFVFTTEGSWYYTNLSIYTGSTVDDLDKAACGSFLHGDLDAGTVAATLAATAGTVYHIQIDFFGGFFDGGPVTLNANVNLAPTAVLVTPRVSTVFAETPAAIDAVYSDPNTFNNLRYLDLKVTAGGGAPLCQVRFNNDKRQFQIKDGGWIDVGWPAGPSAHSTEFCTLDAGESGFSYFGPDPDVVRVRFALSFSSDFVGRHGLRLMAVDDAGAQSARERLGRIFVEEAPPAPWVSPVKSKVLVNTSTDFHVAVTDPEGWEHVRWVELRITAGSGAPACRMRYTQADGEFWIWNGDEWISDTASPSPSECTSFGRLSYNQAEGAGDLLLIKFVIRFRDEFVGRHGLRLKIKDDDGVVTPIRPYGQVVVEAS